MRNSHPGARAFPPPRGFTLIDVMITVALIGILSALASENLDLLLMRAKRTEAVLGLNSVWLAEKTYYANEGHYAGTFDLLGSPIEGGVTLSPVSVRGQQYTYHLARPWGDSSFYCAAVGNIDQDPWPDVVTIEEGRP